MNEFKDMKFTQSDFIHPEQSDAHQALEEWQRIDAVRMANARLKEMLAAAPEIKYSKEYGWHELSIPCDDTHTARLVCIEEIKLVEHWGEEAGASVVVIEEIKK
jgi:hypothetical protein